MTLASRSLEQAIFALAKADVPLIDLLGGEKLFDEPRQAAVFPYVTLTTTFSRDWSTGTERGEEHRLTMTVWAGSNARQQHQDIIVRLRALLDDPALVLEGHHLVNLRLERCESRRDKKTHILRAQLQIRAVTEEIATP